LFDGFVGLGEVIMPYIMAVAVSLFASSSTYLRLFIALLLLLPAGTAQEVLAAVKWLAKPGPS
jgi:presenilin-like A22 family membrane protease